MKVMREQFFHPEVIKLFNLKEILELDDLGMLCRRRISPEEGRELKICLPSSLREVVFQTCHLADTIHRGVEATVKAISDRFFFLHMNADLRARHVWQAARLQARPSPPVLCLDGGHRHWVRRHHAHVRQDGVEHDLHLLAGVGEQLPRPDLY